MSRNNKVDQQSSDKVTQGAQPNEMEKVEGDFCTVINRLVESA